MDVKQLLPFIPVVAFAGYSIWYSALAASDIANNKAELTKQDRKIEVMSNLQYTNTIQQARIQTKMETLIDNQHRDMKLILESIREVKR